jgi:hypothetical protein
MPSPAKEGFSISLSHASTLSEIAGDGRIRPITRQDARTFLHASLAAQVAAWDSFVKALVDEFFVVVARPLDPNFSSHHAKLQALKDAAKKKFNTPNSDNARTYILIYTGYDPINDWVWPQRRMGGVLVRERLNEVLHVRHSFAHGHAMPAYQWNTSAAGDARLTMQIIADLSALFVNLVSRTDRGLHSYILTNYGVNSGWY